MNKQNRSEILRLYVGSACNMLLGGFSTGLAMRAMAEKQYLLAAACGVIGGFNTVVGIRKLNEAMRQK